MKEEQRILDLVSEGVSPCEIAAECKISTASVIQHISTAVNEGRLRRSDVLSTLRIFTNKEWQTMVDTVAQNRSRPSPKRICDLLNSAFAWNIDVDELELYLAYKGRPINAGDLYEMLHAIEVTLHSRIKAVLIKAHGPEETGWWRQGVPQKVRAECAAARECDQDSESLDEPYNYTTVIHLSQIIDNQWRLFQPALPEAIADNKKDFLSDLRRLNGIRNRVMHPVRGGPLGEEELRFVKRMQEKLDLSKWRK